MTRYKTRSRRAGSERVSLSLILRHEPVRWYLAAKTVGSNCCTTVNTTRGRESLCGEFRGALAVNASAVHLAVRGRYQETISEVGPLTGLAVNELDFRRAMGSSSKKVPPTGPVSPGEVLGGGYGTEVGLTPENSGIDDVRVHGQATAPRHGEGQPPWDRPGRKR